LKWFQGVEGSLDWWKRVLGVLAGYVQWEVCGGELMAGRG